MGMDSAGVRDAEGSWCPAASEAGGPAAAGDVEMSVLVSTASEDKAVTEAKLPSVCVGGGGPQIRGGQRRAQEPGRLALSRG